MISVKRYENYRENSNGIDSNEESWGEVENLENNSEEIAQKPRGTKCY